MYPNINRYQIILLKIYKNNFNYKKMLILKKIKKKAFYLQDYIIIKHKKLFLNKKNRIKLIFILIFLLIIFKINRNKYCKLNFNLKNNKNIYQVIILIYI